VPTPKSDRLCLALDVHDDQEILRVVDELKDLVGCFKLNSAFTLFGPALVREILSRGAKVFLDLKLHDIPNTLAGYGDAVVRLGVHIVTVHVDGGTQMLQDFVRSADHRARQLGVPRPRLIGISLLTSIDQATMNHELNVPGSLEDEVLRRGILAAQAGLDGMVCSAAELAVVKPHLPCSFYYVTPGVRPAGAGGDDHKRIVSYTQALRAGSDLLVIGRTVLGAPDPRAALRAVHDTIASEG
jgi:orotidine-5'-phosphate decarboxylase